MSLEATLSPLFNWNYTGSDPFGNSIANRLNYTDGVDQFTDGDGDQEVQLIYQDRRTITAASTNDDIDLSGGVTDVFGQTLAFTAIKGLLIHNRSTVEGDELTVGGAGSGAIVSLFKGNNSYKLTVPASGTLMLVAPLAGYAVTATTADLLRVTHSGTSSTVSYDIIVIGVGTAS